jgi:hypothetical protein
VRHDELRIRFSTGRRARRAGMKALAAAGVLMIAAIAVIAWMVFGSWKKKRTGFFPPAP